MCRIHAVSHITSMANKFPVFGFDLGDLSRNSVRVERLSGDVGNAVTTAIDSAVPQPAPVGFMNLGPESFESLFAKSWD